MNIKSISKYLSYILRHKPDAIGVAMDSNGWVSVDELIEKTTDYQLTKAIIKEVVETNDKQRFILNEDESQIRANQGHSIEIDLKLEPISPPAVLYHGTASRFIESIKQQGLCKQKRHHVHLTESKEIASAVGRRYGKLVMLEINAEQMAADGIEFYKSANNVWLVDHVPTEYLI